MSFTITFDEKFVGGSVRLLIPGMTTEIFMQFASSN